MKSYLQLSNNDNNKFSTIPELQKALLGSTLIEVLKVSLFGDSPKFVPCYVLQVFLLLTFLLQ